MARYQTDTTNLQAEIKKLKRNRSFYLWSIAGFCIWLTGIAVANIERTSYESLWIIPLSLVFWVTLFLIYTSSTKRILGLVHIEIVINDSHLKATRTDPIQKTKSVVAMIPLDKIRSMRRVGNDLIIGFGEVDNLVTQVFGLSLNDNEGFIEELARSTNIRVA